MVDAVKLRNVLSRLKGRLERLRGFGARDRDDYLADEDAVDSSKYVLITAIEDALVIANHVIASEGFRGPSSARCDEGVWSSGLEVLLRTGSGHGP